MIFDFKIWKNTYFKFQLEFGKNSSNNLFEFELSLTEEQDNAGFNFIFGIDYLFHLSIKIYDNRNWDHKNNCWIKYD